MVEVLTMKVDIPKRITEAGYGRARLDPEAYTKLGLSIGNIIEIAGKKTVVAKVFRSDAEDEERRHQLPEAVLRMTVKESALT